MPSVHANRRSSAASESGRRPVVLASLLLALLLGLVSAGAWWGGWFGAKEDPRLTEVKTVMADAAAKYPPDQAPKNMLETAARPRLAAGGGGCALDQGLLGVTGHARHAEPRFAFALAF